MRTVITYLLPFVFSLTVFVVPTTTFAQGTQIGGQDAPADTYYTQVNFWGRRGSRKIPHKDSSLSSVKKVDMTRTVVIATTTANYSIGHFVPINTKVTKHAVTKDLIVMNIQPTSYGYIDPNLSESHLRLKNKQGYSGKSSDELFDALFDTQPVDLDSMPDDISREIRQGDITEGMTKDQVIMARGYPPVHYTPSLEKNLWIYFEGPEHTEEVFFKNGKVH